MGLAWTPFAERKGINSAKTTPIYPKGSFSGYMEPGMGFLRTVLDLEDGSRTENHGLGIEEVWPSPCCHGHCTSHSPVISVVSVMSLYFISLQYSNYASLSFELSESTSQNHTKRYFGSCGVTAAELFTLTLFRRGKIIHRATYFNATGQRSPVRDVATVVQYDSGTAAMCNCPTTVTCLE